jgi:F-type H+-transporting ATPase subunit b
MLNARSDEIRKTYEDARRDKIEAETSKKIYADKLLGAESERDKIISEATAAAKVTESQIIKKASSKAEKIISTASVNSEKIQKRALESAKDELSSLAIEIAQKIAQKEIDPESNEKLIEDFIDSLDVKPL